MALFTSKADSDLPLLTQLYQLDDDEILTWLEQWNRRHPYAPITRSEGTQAIISELLVLIRASMGAIVAGRHPEHQIKQDLNEWLATYLTPPQIHWHTPVLGIPSQPEHLSAVEIFETGSPQVTHGVNVGNSVAALCSRVLLELLWLIEHGKLGRCEECKGVYQVTEKKQKVGLIKYDLW